MKTDDSRKDNDEKRDQVSTESVDLSSNNQLCHLLPNEENPKNVIILSKANGLIEDKDCPVIRLLPRQQTNILRNKIPRNVVSLDEKYLRRCLELIHISASSKADSCNISVNFLNSARRGISSKCSDSDMSRIVLEIPMEVSTGSSMIGSKIAGYKNIMRFLDRPPLHKLGKLEFDSFDTKASIIHTATSSPGRLSNYSPLKNQKGDLMNSGNPKPRPGNLHKRFVSVSSTNSTYSSSDQSSSSKTVSKGIVHCRWKNGAPCFVFSSDDSKDEYSAELTAVESVDDDDIGLKYVYLFHSRKTGANEFCLVGKMNVSTSFSVSPTDSKIMEREFVLFSCGDSSQAPCFNSRKHKGLQRKVVDAFKNSRTSRKRRISRFSETNSTSDFCSWEPYQETADTDTEYSRGINLLDEDLPANFESAAIVVKENVLETQEEEEIGGWGLKFLKKTALSQTQDSFESSRSIDVILPAGLHGGPRTRIGGGPSSLIERWKSNGECDCGRWDLGCALTVLTSTFEKLESSLKTGSELSIAGSKGGLPGLRVVGVQEGLYLVEFQTRSSALQSFSIAVAYIHSQSLKLRPKIPTS